MARAAGMVLRVTVVVVLGMARLDLVAAVSMGGVRFTVVLARLRETGVIGGRDRFVVGLEGRVVRHGKRLGVNSMGRKRINLKRISEGLESLLENQGILQTP